MMSFRDTAKPFGVMVDRVIGIQEAACWFRVPATRLLPTGRSGAAFNF